MPCHPERVRRNQPEVNGQYPPSHCLKCGLPIPRPSFCAPCADRINEAYVLYLSYGRPAETPWAV